MEAEVVTRHSGAGGDSIVTMEPDLAGCGAIYSLDCSMPAVSPHSLDRANRPGPSIMD